MTTQMIINIVLTFLLPILTGIVIWIYRVMTLRLPDTRTLLLERCARWAVRYIEHNYPDSTSKRELSESIVINIYKHYKLPLPYKEKLDIAIDAETFTVKNFRNKADL